MRVKAEERHELKYLLRWEQAEAVRSDLSAYLSPDRHGDGEGRYTITSLYYDTADYKAYWDKLEGHKFRRKVRVRVYGDHTVTPDTACFVEIKQRTNKLLQKKRVCLPHREAIPLADLVDVLEKVSPEERAVLQEVLYLHQVLDLRPACIVRYDRLAYEGSEEHPDLRITFDTNLRCRTHDLTLLSTGYAADRFFLPPQWCIMEVKVNRTAPYWLTQILHRHRCVLRRISKYCAALEKSKVLLSRQHLLTPTP